jgi:[acyl-carrier-protein] S-malonyltransferase
MNKIAFIFPGQGSQSIGMGIAVANAFPLARDIFSQANEILGWDLFKACQEGPEERLRQTDVAQPALYVTGYAASAVMRSRDFKPSGFAGHSIGEYAALAAAGVFSFEQGLRLVQVRGQLMQEAAQKHPGAMAAILGLSPEKTQELCKQAETDGICVPVNFNSPEQIVIAGEKKAVEKVSALATEAGAKRVIALNVSGAFHSPLMAEAAQAMRAELSKVTFKNAEAPVAMNADGQLQTEASAIQERLARQLNSSVQWVKSIEALKADGVTTFIECGAGRVLMGLMRRIDKQLQAFSTETPEAFQEIGNRLSSSSSAVSGGGSKTV